MKYSLPPSDERFRPTLRKYAEGQISAYDAACEIQDLKIPGYHDPSASEVILWAVAAGFGIPAPSEEEAQEEATRILEKLNRIEVTARTLLSVSTGNCMGRMVDVDGRGVEEFETCDDSFAYGFCSFAFSPFPTVVFAYNAATGMFELATPTFAAYYEDQRLRELVDARQTMADYRDDGETVRCAALRPALSLVYGGQAEEGLALFRQLYERPDGLMLWQQVLDLAAQSPFWIPR